MPSDMNDCTCTVLMYCDYTSCESKLTPLQTRLCFVPWFPGYFAAKFKTLIQSDVTRLVRVYL